MGYVTDAELAAIMYGVSLVQCTDDDNDTVADATVVAQLHASASGIADGYLQTAGYAVPVTPTAALKHHVAFIEAHFAASRRQKFRNAQGVAPYRTEYLDAIAWLEKIAAGDIRLEGQEPTAASSSSESGTGGKVMHAYRGQRAPRRGARGMRGW